MIATWKKIPDYPDYSVSSDGFVRRDTPGRGTRAGKILKAPVAVRGYRVLVLKNENGRRMFTIHRLVAMAFIPNPNQKATVNHIDGNKLNNCVDNLEWATHAEQTDHAKRLRLGSNRGETHVLAKLKSSDIPKIREMAKTLPTSEVGRLFGVSRQCIRDIVTRRNWSNVA